MMSLDLSSLMLMSSAQPWPIVGKHTMLPEVTRKNSWKPCERNRLGRIPAGIEKYGNQLNVRFGAMFEAVLASGLKSQLFK